MANEINVTNDTVSIETPVDGKTATVISDVCEIATVAGLEGVIAPVVVERPEAGDSYSLVITPGKEYFLDFEQSEVQSMVQQGDNLIITLEDGGSLTLIDFMSATNHAEIPAKAAFRDPFALSKFADMIEVIETVPSQAELVEPQAEVRQTAVEEAAPVQQVSVAPEQVVARIEPAAGQDMAQTLAEIEPAAGETGAAGGRGGYGFTSSFDPQGVAGLADVGPIDPTALQYRANFYDGKIYPLRDGNDIPRFVSSVAERLDETNLSDGPIERSGTLRVNFGNDGPGTIEANGNFSANGSVLGDDLSHNGAPIEVTHTPSGYVGKVGDTVIFTMEIDTATGAYKFTQYESIDHKDGTDPNDEIHLIFGFVATDSDGDSSSTTVSVTILDDAPVLEDDDLGTINEASIGPVTVNGDLSENFGADGAGKIETTNQFDASGAVRGDALTSGGQKVIVTATETGYEGRTEGSNELVFKLELKDQTTGAYDFTLFKGLDHADGDDIIKLQFGVKITDYDGDSDTANIVVRVADDGPSIPGGDNPDMGKGQGTVKESDLDGGPAEVTGKVDFDFGGDGAGCFGATGEYDLGGLTSGGKPIDVVFDPDTGTYTGTVDGETIFTMVVEENGEYKFTLIGTVDHPDTGDHNDVVQISFEIKAKDADGDKATGKIIINIVDDGPVIGDDAFTISEAGLENGPIVVKGDLDEDFGADGPGAICVNGDHTVTGLNGAPLTSNGEVVTVTVVDGAYVGKTPNGEVVFELKLTDDKGGYEFTLHKPLDHGDSDISLKFGVKIKDGDGDTDTGTITINVKNDVPTIPGGDTPAIGKGQETVDETDLSGGPQQVEGKVDFSFGGDGAGEFGATGGYNLGGLTSGGEPIDVAFDSATGTYTGTAGGETIFTLVVKDDGSYSFTLIGTVDHPNAADPNDSVQVSFDVAVTDADGDKATGKILINILDDGPVANDDFVTFEKSEVEVGGNVVANDKLSQDGPNTVTKVSFGGNPVDVPPTGVAVINGQYGKLEISADGTYKYTLFDGHSGADVQDQFVYTLKDSDGDSDTATLSINIQNDDVLIVVNNGADSVCVKEDGSVDVPVTAEYGGGNGNEVMTLTLEGVEPGWEVTTPGWENVGGGKYVLTLPAGQRTYDGTFTFKPPANSDVDLNNVKVTASVYDPDTSGTRTSDDSFDINVDAVVDAPIFEVQDFQSYDWHKDYQHEVPLHVYAAVTDTDGSEVITKIQIDLNNPFSNPAGGFTSLADLGMTLNKGVEISPGVWEIEVNAGNTTDALNGLKMIMPVGGEDFWPIHQSRVGEHKASITVKAFVQEQNLSGVECDYSDNQLVVSKDIGFKFYITPLVLDLTGTGIDLVPIDEGTLFDMDSDGTLDRTSWIGQNSGLLAIDLNGDGIINDHSELFGNGGDTDNGFAHLALYDTNGDGIINANDEVFENLIVWRDVNGDGISQDGEMFSLTDLNIISINLNATETGYELNGNYISHDSFFTYADGSTGKIVDAWFEVELGVAADEVLYTASADEAFLFEGLDEVEDTEFAGADEFFGFDDLDAPITFGDDADQQIIDAFLIETSVETGVAANSNVPSAELIAFDSAVNLDISHEAKAAYV